MIDDAQTQEFEYDRLKTPSCFRLLRFEGLGAKSLLRCVLEEHEIEASPPFVAVSYCWGFVNLTKIIQVNGGEARVTPNLASILYQLQADARPDEGYVWVDALCINQGDVAEKDEQIKLLPKIFSRAFKTVAQVSRTDSDGSRLRHIKRFVEADMRLPDDATRAKAEYNSLSRGLLALSQLDYWRRIWVVQEVSLAQDIEIICCAERLGWVDFFLAVQLIIKDARAIHPGLTTNMSEFITSSTRRLRELDSLRTRIRNHLQLPLLKAMLWTRDCESTRRQDKIFALLGLVTDEWMPSQNLFYGDQLLDTEKKITLAHIESVSPIDSALDRVYSLDVITFADLSLWRAGHGRWMPRWTYAPLWTTMRKWQQLRLDWSLAQFAASPGLSSMPKRSDLEALEVRGFYLGRVCAHREKAPWLYKDPADLLRAARGLLHELQRYPRKAVLDWPVKGSDEQPESVIVTADLTGHRKWLQALIEYVQSVVVIDKTGPPEQESTSENTGLMGEDADSETETATRPETEQYRLYQSELRHFLLMGSSPVEASSTWTFDLMKFTHTIRGFLGFGVVRSQPGDIVYLIRGCSTPVILRRFGSGLTPRGYVVVGEMLVLGLMQGEFFRDPAFASFAVTDASTIQEEILEIL